MTTQQITQPIEITTGLVQTEGDEIYYEVRGQGQPLLMISGGGGDAGFYSFVADILAAEYKVITYDRRGNSRSSRSVPQNFEISQQSRDAVAVLKAAGETSATIFGNSGGAVIALDIAKTQPQVCRAVIAHEPPVVRVHPDSTKWLRFFAAVYGTTLRFGSGLGILRFNLPMGIPFSAYRFIPKDFATRNGANHDFFLKNEMIPFTNYTPDLDMIQRNGVKIFMAAGQITLSKEKFYGETSVILSQQMGCEMVIFPGHHLSYFDMPDIWAATLRGVLHRAG